MNINWSASRIVSMKIVLGLTIKRSEKVCLTDDFFTDVY